MIVIFEFVWQLLGFNIINLLGSEVDCMWFFVDWFDDSGFEVLLLLFGEGCCNFIVSLFGVKSGKLLVFIGYLDIVLLGNVCWQYDFFGLQMEDGCFYGCGFSDMKVVIVVFVVVCVYQWEVIFVGCGVVLLIIGGEEIGCDGVWVLIVFVMLLEVGVLIVGEFIVNYLVIGYKGVFWLCCEMWGKIVYGVMLELGINVIYFVVDVLGKIQYFLSGVLYLLMK